MELVIADANDAKAIRSTGGSVGLLSITQVRELFKDSLKDGTYTIEGPGGALHQFNLERWAGKDPDRTFIQMSFRTATPGVFNRGTGTRLP